MLLCSFLVLPCKCWHRGAVTYSGWPRVWLQYNKDAAYRRRVCHLFPACVMSWLRVLSLGRAGVIPCQRVLLDL